MRDESLDTARIKVAKPRGRHPDRRLTAVHIRNMKRPGRYADGNGLYLFVDKSGAKRWLLRTVVAGKRCDIGLGSVKLVSLADARDEAIRLRALARKGLDVLGERRQERRTIPTFNGACFTVRGPVGPSADVEYFKVSCTGRIGVPFYRWDRVPPTLRTATAERLNAAVRTDWFTGTGKTGRDIVELFADLAALERFIDIWQQVRSEAAGQS